MKAFPITTKNQTGAWGEEGMDLRDYFAAQAMQGMITTAAAPCLSGLDGLELHTAKYAYKIADAMMEARNK